MALGKQSRAKIKKKLLVRRKRRNKQQRSHSKPFSELSHRQSDRLKVAVQMALDGNHEEARKLLVELERRTNGHPDVVDGLAAIYHLTEDHEQSEYYCDRLAQLRPHDLEAQLNSAQMAMVCGRSAIALQKYQSFLASWPDHEHSEMAENAIDLLTAEVKTKIEKSGFDEQHGVELLALHDESLRLLQVGKYPGCVEKCKALLDRVPMFVSARNNLSLALFHAGRLPEALAVVQETRSLLRDNRFAEAVEAKLLFLNGNIDAANKTADLLVANPPAESDPLLATLEMLAFLGRDDDLVKLAEMDTSDFIPPDSHSQASKFHYLAYAKCRLGETKAAIAAWRDCLEIWPSHNEAQNNLEDLEEGTGHAPWAEPVGKWIPASVVDDVFAQAIKDDAFRLDRFPAMARLIPALLDRGCDAGRDAALTLAKADGSPPMMKIIHQFAGSNRGPDSSRLGALQFLLSHGEIDAGPQRFFRDGNWTEIQMLVAEISSKPKESNLPARLQELSETASIALMENDFSTAEKLFNQVLDEQPDDCTTIYGLCTIWLRRDGTAGQKRARPRLEQLHRDFPD